MLGGGGGGGPAEAARVEKYLKGRLAAAAEHFNRDQKKGFQYLQSLRLLPPQLDPPTVARFLRCCPGLGKASIGEILGERDAFYEEVRQAFMETFDFVGEVARRWESLHGSRRPPGSPSQQGAVHWSGPPPRSAACPWYLRAGGGRRCVCVCVCAQAWTLTWPCACSWTASGRRGRARRSTASCRWVWAGSRAGTHQKGVA